MDTLATKPQPHELWKQAAGDTARYLDLMIEHGHVVAAGREAELPEGERIIAATRRERVEAEARDLKRQFDSHALKITRTGPLTFDASCACELWAIKDQQLSHRADNDACRLLVAERHEEHVRSMVAKFETTGSGGCQLFRATDGRGRVMTGVICTGRSTAGRKRCQVCKSKTRWSVAQCDFPVGGDCKKCKGTGLSGSYNCHDCAGTGRAMCNLQLCAACRVKGPGADEDYCPAHRSAAGLKLRREPCEWAQADVSSKCIHRGCETVVVEGERCLWFTKRLRPMCLKCGAEYLEKSEEA